MLGPYGTHNHDRSRKHGTRQFKFDVPLGPSAPLNVAKTLPGSDAYPILDSAHEKSLHVACRLGDSQIADFITDPLVPSEDQTKHRLFVRISLENLS